VLPVIEKRKVSRDRMLIAEQCGVEKNNSATRRKSQSLERLRLNFGHILDVMEDSFEKGEVKSPRCVVRDPREGTGVHIDTGELLLGLLGRLSLIRAHRTQLPQHRCDARSTLLRHRIRYARHGAGGSQNPDKSRRAFAPLLLRCG